MKQNEIGKWVHPAFAATSMAFLLTIIDKEALVYSSGYLIFSVYFYALALLLNSIWSYIYYIEDSEIDVNKKLRSTWVGKGLDNLSYWSFVFPTVSVVLYLIIRTSSTLK